MGKTEMRGRQAAWLAKRCGYESITCVTAGVRCYAFSQVASGFRSVWGKRGLKWVECDASMVGAYERLVAAFGGRDRTQALFTYGDDRTLGALMAMERLNLSIPGDVGLLAYGLASESVRRAQVTGLVEPRMETGHAAARMLKDQIAGRPVERRIVVRATVSEGRTMVV